MAEDLQARIREGLVSKAAVIRAARLGNEAAQAVCPQVESARDLDELVGDVRGQRFSWTEKIPCVRLAIAAARYCFESCRALVPELEASAAVAAITTAENWCESPWSDTAEAARESARTCALLVKDAPGGNLVSGVVGACASAAEAAGATQVQIWRGASAAAVGEALSVVHVAAAKELRSRLGAPTEEDKAKVGQRVDDEILAAVRSELVPWLLGCDDPVDTGSSDPS